MATRILVAEDDPIFRSLLEEILGGEGYDVTAKENGLLAWEHLRLEGADMAVLDVDMPELNGFELLRRIRSDGTFHSLPVIMFTVKNMNEDQIAGYEYGADDYIAKPFDSGLLVAKLRALSRRTGR